MRKLFGISFMIFLAGATPVAYASGELTCAFSGKDSIATVKNTNAFQKTCEFECIYNTEGDEHINRGKAGLNAGQSWTQKAQSSSRIKEVKSKKVDC